MTDTKRKRKEPKVKEKKVGGGKVYTMPPYPHNEPLPPPPNFLNIMNFTTIWPLLLDHGASPKKEEGARRFWNNLTQEQQQAAFINISRKLEAQAFVHFDPIRAIRENSWQAKAPQPIWLRGDEGGDIVQVRYNGAFKLCSRADMELFGLQWVRDW